MLYLPPTFASHLTRFLEEEDGQTLVEYGLLTALITLACVAAINVLRTRVRNGFNTAISGLNTSSA